MRVIWQKNAIRQRDQIAEYVRQEFGTKRKTRFLKELRNSINMLRNSPYIGKVDPLFTGRTHTYRSIIYNNLNKIIYRIDDDTIHIVAFWDTRMEPEEQARQVK